MLLFIIIYIIIYKYIIISYTNFTCNTATVSIYNFYRKFKRAAKNWYFPGIEPQGNVVGAPARFIVETANAGKGDLEVIVLDPKGKQEKVNL